MKNILFAAFILFCSFGFGQDQLISLTIEEWENNAWHNGSRLAYVYNANDSINNLTTQNYVNGWEDISRLDHTYNPDGTLAVRTEVKRVAGAWANNVRFNYEYAGPGGARSGYIYQNWIGNEWVNSSRETVTYDQAGELPEEIITFSWDSGTSSWQNLYRNTYTYDNADHVTQVVQDQWTNGSWSSKDRYSYTYTAFGEVLESKEEVYQNGNWVNFSRGTSTYDQNNLKTNELREGWNAASQSWENVTNINFVNNPDGTVHQYVAQKWEAGNWLNEFRFTNAYGTAVLGLETIATTAFDLYPNPVSTELNIRLSAKSASATATITDALGRVISTQSLSPMATETKINTQQLSPGLYTVTLSNGNVVTAKPFLKL